jgi:hypothetical protein
VENLVMMQLNPDLINNRFHRMVVRELAKKGLREVQPGQNPDLVVRYWANSSQQVNLAAMGNWGAYGPYVGSYWGWIHTTASASSTREGSLIVDLIDPSSKAPAWRVYLIRKITNPDKTGRKPTKNSQRDLKATRPPKRKRRQKRKNARNTSPRTNSHSRGSPKIRTQFPAWRYTMKPHLTGGQHG